MLKLLKNVDKKSWLFALVVFGLVLVQVWLELKMPDYMSEITVLVQSDGSEMIDILKNGAYMLACAFGSVVAAVVTGFFTAKMSATLSMRIRKRLFNKVEELSMNEIKEFSTSSLITRTTNDITQIQMFVAMGLQLMIKAPVTAIWAITKILNKGWQWSAVTGLGVVILLSVIITITAIVVPKFKIVQKLIDKMNGVLGLSGLLMLRNIKKISLRRLMRN